MASKLRKQQMKGRWADSGIVFAPGYLQQVRLPPGMTCHLQSCLLPDAAVHEISCAVR